MNSKHEKRKHEGEPSLSQHRAQSPAPSFATANFAKFYGCKNLGQLVRKKPTTTAAAHIDESGLERQKKNKVDFSSNIESHSQKPEKAYVDSNKEDNAPYYDETPLSPVRCQFDAESFAVDEKFQQREQARAPSRSYLAYDDNEDKWYELNYDDPRQRRLANGSYAYITHTKDYAKQHQLLSRILVWPVIGEKHNDTFHIGLSFFSQTIAYSGEVTINKGKIVEWNNASGAYKPPFKKKTMATLPPTKFKLPTFAF